MEETGVEITDDPVVVLRSVDGDHVKEFAPVALIVTLFPSQTFVLAALAITLRLVATEMVMVEEDVHPSAEVPVTVYVVVDAGPASTVDPELDVNPLEGLQR
jgi:hypothetical protein